MRNNEAGYTTLKVLVILLVLSVVAMGATGLYHYALAPLQRIKDETAAAQAMAKALARFQELRQTDPTPLADSPGDPVWQLNEADIDGWKVSLGDSSSRLNLNWIQLDIVAKTALAGLLLNDKTTDDLKQYREDIGYTLSLETAYKDYFKPETIKLLFTADSYANVSVSFEECLEDLYRFRTDDKGDATGFRADVVAHLQQKKLWTDDELDTRLGTSKEQVFPWINTWPSMNIHFVPEDILVAVLTYPFPDGVIQNGQAIADQIAELRKNGEITAEQWKAMVPITKEQQKRVFEFLGTRTWVWNLKVSRDDISLEKQVHTDKVE